MTPYEELLDRLQNVPKRWLVTGVAGFIGSHLLETLLKHDQTVVGLDNLSTGHLRNLEEVQRRLSPEQQKRFIFLQGDIRDATMCQRACDGVDYVLHQAALGSVPRSIADPVTSHAVNVNGLLNMLMAARECKTHRFVYASSSSVYGDSPALPKREDLIGNPLSPYALTKLANELYARVFAKCYGLEAIGLRYFNVFGPRQDPDGPYAAVIPKWIAGLLRDEPIEIYGDGETSRDFCFVDNVVQANLLAAAIADRGAVNQVYNVAVNDRTTLNQLFRLIKDILVIDYPHLAGRTPVYKEFRPGDVRHSQADISRAQELIQYRPMDSVSQGMTKTLAWYKASAFDSLAPAQKSRAG